MLQRRRVVERGTFLAMAACPIAATSLVQVSIIVSLRQQISATATKRGKRERKIHKTWENVRLEWLWMWRRVDLKKPKFERAASLDLQRRIYPRELKYKKYSMENYIQNKEMRTQPNTKLRRNQNLPKFLHVQMEYIQLKMTSDNAQGDKDNSVARKVIQTIRAIGETEG